MGINEEASALSGHLVLSSPYLGPVRKARGAPLFWPGPARLEGPGISSLDPNAGGPRGLSLISWYLWRGDLGLDFYVATQAGVGKTPAP